MEGWDGEYQGSSDEQSKSWPPLKPTTYPEKENVILVYKTRRRLSLSAEERLRGAKPQALVAGPCSVVQRVVNAKLPVQHGVEVAKKHGLQKTRRRRHRRPNLALDGLEGLGRTQTLRVVSGARGVAESQGKTVQRLSTSTPPKMYICFHHQKVSSTGDAIAGVFNLLSPCFYD